MKKIAIILLLFSYLIPAVGLSVKQHYCGGKLASVSIMFTDSPSCPCGKKPMKKDCCKDKTIVLKLKDNQNYSKRITFFYPQTFKFIAHCFPVYNFNYAAGAFQMHIPFAHPPPLQKSEPLFLLNSVFLI